MFGFIVCCNSSSLDLIKADFLALLLALVYIGSVLILFIFVIMIFNLKNIGSRLDFGWFLFFSVIASTLFAGFLIYITKEKFAIYDNINLVSNFGGARELVLLAKQLFTEHLVSFVVAGILLLSAIVITIGLNIKDLKSDNNLI